MPSPSNSYFPHWAASPAASRTLVRPTCRSPGCWTDSAIRGVGWERLIQERTSWTSTHVYVCLCKCVCKHVRESCAWRRCFLDGNECLQHNLSRRRELLGLLHVWVKVPLDLLPDRRWQLLWVNIKRKKRNLLSWVKTQTCSSWMETTLEEPWWSQDLVSHQEPVHPFHTWATEGPRDNGAPPFIYAFTYYFNVIFIFWIDKPCP